MTAVNVSGGESKVWYYTEKYCIGTWNVRSMSQDKLDMVKWEMARMNINILGISELKWMGMDEFNSDDNYIYYCGQGLVRRNDVAFEVNKRVLNAVLRCNLKNNRMILVHFQGKPFNITIIQISAPTNDAKKVEVDCFFGDLEHLLELIPKKKKKKSFSSSGIGMQKYKVKIYLE